MPELPEVETIRRQLSPFLSGKRIVGIEVSDPSLVAPQSPAVFKKDLKGHSIDCISRRGKYLLFELDAGHALVIHLRMTGRLTQATFPLPRGARKHLRLVLRFNDGSGLVFHDMRRFGKAFILTREQVTSYWRKLGPEPLGRSFNASYFSKKIEKRTRPIKSLLLDQTIVAGIGNIYADEALFVARIHPMRPSGDLKEAEIGRLVDAIKKTLRRAIKLEGSSIDTYRDSQGQPGRFQETFRVHRRLGKVCPGCGRGLVEKIKVGGRGTYFCPSCQK